MRPLSLVLPASLMWFAATVNAQTGNYPLTNGISVNNAPISTVQVMAAAPPFRIWDYQAEAVSGAYALSNGWGLKVTPASDGVFVKLDNQKPVRLVALSENKFVSRDGNIAIEFNRGATGDDMMMSYVPDAPLAQMIVVTATMAQR